MTGDTETGGADTGDAVTLALLLDLQDLEDLEQDGLEEGIEVTDGDKLGVELGSAEGRPEG